MKKILLLLLVVLLLISTVLYLTKKVQSPTLSTAQLPQSPATRCGLTITSPLPNQTVTLSPDNTFVVRGVVDNTKRTSLGCSWTVFEAQAGVIKAYNTQGNIVGSGILTAQEGQDWMTDQPTVYEGSVQVSSVSSEFTLKIIEDNPSGEGSVDSIEIPLKK